MDDLHRIDCYGVVKVRIKTDYLHIVKLLKTTTITYQNTYGIGVAISRSECKAAFGTGNLESFLICI